MHMSLLLRSAQTRSSLVKDSRNYLGHFLGLIRDNQNIQGGKSELIYPLGRNL